MFVVITNMDMAMSDSPTTFPFNGSQSRRLIPGHPEILTDSYIIEYHANQLDINMVKDVVGEINIHTESWHTINELVLNCDKRLSKPLLIYSNDTMRGFVMRCGTDIFVTLQCLYVKYFSHKYPGCEFFSDGDPYGIVAVRWSHENHGNDLVGAIMPMVVMQNSIMAALKELKVDAIT